MIDVAAQPYALGLLLYFGILAGLVYGILALIRCRSGKRIVTHLCDGAFVLFAAVLFCLGLWYANRIIVRGYLIAAFVCGILLGRQVLRPLFTRMSQKKCK